MVVSSLAEMARVPSRENATERTSAKCPSKVRSNSPVAASQSFTVLSWLPDKTFAPSDENATDPTRLECPRSARSRLPLAASHILMLVPQPPESTCLPSGEKATDSGPQEESSLNVRTSFPVTVSHSLVVL